MNRVKKDIQAIIEDITATTETLRIHRKRLEPIKKQCFGADIAEIQISLKDSELASYALHAGKGTRNR